MFCSNCTSLFIIRILIHILAVVQFVSSNFAYCSVELVYFMNGLSVYLSLLIFKESFVYAFTTIAVFLAARYAPSSENEQGFVDSTATIINPKQL